MGITYENQRVVFNGIVKKYNEYVLLYEEINNGSRAGITPFSQFYWRMIYWSKYADRRHYGHTGY